MKVAIDIAAFFFDLLRKCMQKGRNVRKLLMLFPLFRRFPQKNPRKTQKNINKYIYKKFFI